MPLGHPFTTDNNPAGIAFYTRTDNGFELEWFLDREDKDPLLILRHELTLEDSQRILAYLPVSRDNWTLSPPYRGKPSLKQDHRDMRAELRKERIARNVVLTVDEFQLELSLEGLREAVRARWPGEKWE